MKTAEFLIIGIFFWLSMILAVYAFFELIYRGMK